MKQDTNTEEIKAQQPAESTKERRKPPKPVSTKRLAISLLIKLAAIALADSDHSVAFTNTRNGIIPTGVIMTIAPFAIGICVFGAVIIFIICRRKRRNY